MGTYDAPYVAIKALYCAIDISFSKYLIVSVGILVILDWE